MAVTRCRLDEHANLGVAVVTSGALASWCTGALDDATMPVVVLLLRPNST